jgi:hypothetical protein
MPAKVERRPSEQARRSSNDASVLRVLDKLASQRTKIGSLRELREQKELLMEGEYEPPADVHVTMLEASGIVINVTTSARCAPPSKVDEILVLVHGGLFMSGSPRTCQHLASKLCDELNVPVATPVPTSVTAADGGEAGSGSVPACDPVYGYTVSSTAATTSAASDLAAQSQPQQTSAEQAPSTITVEVLGYGGGEDRSDEEDEVRG